MSVDETLPRVSTPPGVNTESQKIILETPQPHVRLAYFISVWSFKAAIAVGLAARRWWRRGRALPQPELKSYSIRPDLENRIFRPDVSGDEKLPLYLDVHGGGWAVADPETDDEFCSFLAQTFSIIVVSINYHKSPTYKFPCAVDDVAAISIAVINDESLNIDKTKVVLGGFSAGGNLAFAASLTEGLRGRLSGLVGFFAALDLTESVETKLQRRPPNAGTDALKSSANFLTWAYIGSDVDLRDPLLSPGLADPKDLPSNLYLVGAEYDMLCPEAERMAESVAASSTTGCERTGILGVDPEDGWRQGGVRWECARRKYHAFTHVEERGQKEIERVKFCQEMYCRIGTWLTKEVWL